MSEPPASGKSDNPSTQHPSGERITTARVVLRSGFHIKTARETASKLVPSPLPLGSHLAELQTIRHGKSVLIQSTIFGYMIRVLWFKG